MSGVYRKSDDNPASCRRCCGKTKINWTVLLTSGCLPVEVHTSRRRLYSLTAVVTRSVRGHRVTRLATGTMVGDTA